MAGPRIEKLSDFVTTPIRHTRVGQHQGRRIRLDLLDCLLPTGDGDHVQVLVGQRQLDDTLNGEAVVGDKQCL